MVRSILQAVTTAAAIYGLTANAQEPLAPKTTQTLDQAVEAYQKGRLGDALRLAEPVLQSLSPEQIGLADRRLREDHQLELSLVGLASFCRVELVLAGQGARLGRPPAAELPAALEALDNRIAFLLEPVRRELETGMPAIIPNDVLTEKIATIRPLLTQIDQAGLLVAHINQLAGQVRAAERAQLEPRPGDIAGRKLADEKKKLESVRDRMTSRLVEYCLILLNSSLNTLGDEGAGFRRRFAATQEASAALVSLQLHWDRYKRWKHRNGGIDPSVEQRWRRQEELVRIQSGPLLQKAYLFDQGVQWWLRGRFGRGPIGGGLAKIAPLNQSTNRQIDSLAMGPLFMPRQIPKPQNPLTSADPYPIPRRYLEWWRLETRRQAVAETTLFSFLPDEQPGTTRVYFGIPPLPKQSVKFQYTVDLEVIPEDLRLAQLVGYCEYQVSLQHFEELTRLCSPAEIQALDQLVGDDDRLVVHSMLSTKYDGLDPGSTLRMANRPRDARAARPNERRGLAWVMAHARIELGAMRAGHTGESKSLVRRVDFARYNAKPELLADPFGSFEKWPPTHFEREAFLELLWDGARQQFYECSSIITPAGRVASPNGARLTPQGRLPLLQIDRRLRVTAEMLDAFDSFAGATLSPTQRNELQTWRTRIETIHSRIQGALRPDSDWRSPEDLLPPGMTETRENYRRFLEGRGPTR